MGNRPLSPAFNAATLHLANLTNPRGWAVLDDAPDTLEGVQAYAAEHGRLAVWSGAADGTAFADAEVNYAFRAWHDWAHYRYSLPFTLAGETAAAFVQAAHLARLYGSRPSTAAMVAQLLSEVIGQAEHLATTGAFPADQYAFARADFPRWRQVAACMLPELARRCDREAIVMSAHLPALRGMCALNPAAL